MSRRAADTFIQDGRVAVNGQKAVTGQQVSDQDTVTLEGRIIKPPESTQTIVLHKPVGYVCSRLGQGSITIYDLLPSDLHHLKPVGRLDKDSSGLLLLTNDGEQAHQLTHPSFQKEKIYEVRLNQKVTAEDLQKLRQGVLLSDGISKLGVRVKSQGSSDKSAPDSKLISHTSTYEVRLAEGKNRQIRRTFAALGYTVTKLHRTHFGPYTLGLLKPREWQKL